ncbi:CP12 domain-containing protein [Fischerella sp. PCC 9605]
MHLILFLPSITEAIAFVNSFCETHPEASECRIYDV